MDKYEVEKNMEAAYQAINDTFSGKTVDKMMRSKMSAFGAMVVMSGVIPALAYYKQNEPKIIELLWRMYKDESEKNPNDKLENFPMQIAKNMKVDNKIDSKKKQEITEKIINEAISLKLAFNLFTLKDNS